MLPRAHRLAAIATRVALPIFLLVLAQGLRSASAEQPQPENGKPKAPAPADAQPLTAEAAPCKGIRIATLCFSPVSEKSFQFSEIDDYCASLGMKVPGSAEYLSAMPLAPAGHFPKGESLWMSDAWQYNRNLHEMGSAVVWYGPGSWNRGPMSASARLRLSCVDRLLPTKDSTRIHYVGLKKERIAELAKTTAQKDPMWCWAAVAQMIHLLRGQSLSQGDIVRIALDDVNGKGVSAEELARRLQKVGIEAILEKNVPVAGPKFQVSRDGKNFVPMEAYNPLGDSGTPDNIDSRQLALDLYDGVVYILAYGTGESRAHAVLLVGLDVIVTPNDFREISRFELYRYTHKILIKKYHVINPWPGKGIEVLSPDALQELVKWKVNMPKSVQHGPF